MEARTITHGASLQALAATRALLERDMSLILLILLLLLLFGGGAFYVTNNLLVVVLIVLVVLAVSGYGTRTRWR